MACYEPCQGHENHYKNKFNFTILSNNQKAKSENWGCLDEQFSVTGAQS
jgi:hypothetical protein